MATVQINARITNGTIIEWDYDLEFDSHSIRVVEDDATYILNPRDGKEANDMFQHTYLYDWSTVELQPNYIIGKGREFTAPRS